MCNSSFGPYRGRRRGLTLTDLCVLLAMAVLCMAVALPAVRQQASSSNRVKCASNLRQIALAAIYYTHQSVRDSGKFPRTYFNPALADTPALYTAIDAPDAYVPESAGGPKPNDVTTAFFNLLKKSDLTPEAFICPDSDATPLPATFDVSQKSNFPGPEHLAYSYANPYANTKAIQAGWKFDSTLSPDFPLAADINPGDSDQGGPTTVAYDDPPEKMAPANSPNHFYEGQNVVYVDGHTEWQTTPFAGAPQMSLPYRDNIYTSQLRMTSSPKGVGGVILAGPQGRYDSVLLPTARNAPAGAALNLPVRIPGERPSALSQSPMGYVAAGVGLLLLVAAIVIVVSSVRKKPAVAIAGQPPTGTPPGTPPATP